MSLIRARYRAVNTIMNLPRGGGFVGLLDLFHNAAFAPSIRLLRKDYSGGLLRARAWDGLANQGEADIMPYRVSANEYVLNLNSTLENLDATAIGRGLTTSDTLADLVSTGVNDYDGLTSAWYDQSTNGNHATQSTAANQPKIVSGGSLVTENGKPAVDFDGVSSSFNVSKITLSDDWNLFITHKLDSNSYYFGDTIGGDYLRYRINDSYRLQIAGGTDTVTGIGDIIGAQKLLNIERDSSNNLEYYLNGTSAATSSISGAWDIDEIGASVTNHFDGTFQELIIFNSDQSSNRTGIETNINTFYSVYP